MLEYEENYTEDDDASLLRIILFCSYSLSSVSNQLIYLRVIMWVRMYMRVIMWVRMHCLTS